MMLLTSAKGLYFLTFSIEDCCWSCKQGQIRALALRVLAEFLRCHADRFGQYIEATIVRTLEAHRDAIKEVLYYLNSEFFRGREPA